MKNTTTKTTTAKKQTTKATAQKKTIDFDFKTVLKNDEIVKSLKESEKAKIVIYQKIRDLLDDDNIECILQYNYKHAKNNEDNAFNLVRVCYKDNIKAQLTNLYITSEEKIKIFCTAKKAYQEQLKEKNYNDKYFKYVSLKDLKKAINELKAIYKK